MTIEKIYKSLTKNQLGVYRGTEVDKTDGKIGHILEVKHDDGTVEQIHVADSTFKRWWKLVEETTAEDLEESMASLNEIKDTVLKEEPTIEDLKRLNESGEELTEEELELFKRQSTQTDEEQPKEETVVHELPLVKKQRKQPEDSGVSTYFETCIFELGGAVGMYSEPMKRVVKNKQGKTVMFYAVRPNKSIKIFMKEQLDNALFENIQAEEKYTYPKQFPFRLTFEQLTDENKKLLQNILELYV